MLRKFLYLSLQTITVSILALFVRGMSFSDLLLVQMFGDGLNNYAIAKGFVDGLSGAVNPNIGAPYGLSMFATPSLDFIYLIQIWVLSMLTQNGIFAVNAMFFLGFGAAFTASYWVLSKNNSPKTLNVILSLSFAFIPEHWGRQSHTALSLYWTIPLAIHFCLLIANDSFENRFNRIKSRKDRVIEILKLCIFLLFLTSQGAYYAFFTLFFSLIVLLGKILSTKRLPKITLSIFIGQLGLFLGFTLLVSKLATNSGTNLAIFQRATWESILYGGHIPFLFLPWPGSGIPGTSRIGNVLDSAYPANENKIWSAWLISLFMVAMFFALVNRIISSNGRKFVEKTENYILLMFFAGVAIYISGGIGLLIAILEPQIRAWNRVSFFLSFLAILWIVKQIPRIKKIVGSAPLLTKNIDSIVAIVYFLLISLVVIDQFPAGLKNNLTVYRQGQLEMQTFISRLEAGLTSDCMTLQIPVARYPENPPIQKMSDYDQFYPYLFAEKTRFTYGSMKETKMSSWHELLPKTYSSEFLELVSANDFCALLWDRNGLMDSEYSKLLKAIDKQGLVSDFSESKRWGYIYLDGIKSRLTSSQILELRGRLLDSPIVTYALGFSTLESSPEGPFIWSTSKTSKIEITNPSNKLIRQRIEFQVKTSPAGNPRTLEIYNGDNLLSYDLNLENWPVFSSVIEVPANSTKKIQIKVSGRGDKFAGDPRSFYFQIIPIDGFGLKN